MTAPITSPKEGEPLQPDVFISYSSKDRSVAEAACEALEREGFTCWMAPRDIQPGTSYAQSIIEAIRHTKLMVLVFSEWSNRSSQVVREVERTTSLDIPVLPLRIDDTVPTADMEYHLSSRHWLDALNGPSAADLQRLVNAVRASLASLRGVPPPPTETGAATEPRPAGAAPVGPRPSTSPLVPLQVEPPYPLRQQPGAAGLAPQPMASTPGPQVSAPTPVPVRQPTPAGPAGVGVRSVAFLIDVVAMLVLAGVLWFALLLGASMSLDPSLTDAEFDQRLMEMESTMWMVALIVACVAYQVIANKRSVSIGKKLLNLTVVWPGGKAPTWSQALRRGLLVAASALTVVGALVAFFWMVGDFQGRSWHDRLTDSRVARASPADGGGSSDKPGW